MLPFGVLVVPQHQRRDRRHWRRAGRCDRFCRCLRIDAAVGFPLGQQLVVLLPALIRAVATEVVVVAVDPDDGEVLRLVMTVLRLAELAVGHGRVLWSRSTWVLL